MKYIFKPEKELAFCRFMEAYFSPEEVTEIKKLGDSITQNDAVTYGGNSPVRQGSTAWIPKMEKHHGFMKAGNNG